MPNTDDLRAKTMPGRLVGCPKMGHAFGDPAVFSRKPLDMVRTLPRQIYDHETGEDFDVIAGTTTCRPSSEDPRRKPRSR